MSSISSEVNADGCGRDDARVARDGAFEANRSRFAERFRELARLLGLESRESAARSYAAVPGEYRLAPSASGLPTVSVRGSFLHSRYDPARDAERIVNGTDHFDASGCVFAGMGLAYVPELYCRRFPDSMVVILEPDIYLFTLGLASRPLDVLLSHTNLLIVVGSTAREATTLLESLSLDDLPVYENPGITAPNAPWFAEFAEISVRNRQKREINANTLRKFGDLWLRNMSHNLAQMRDRNGITSFARSFAGMPALVLAAGPSLDRILPFLSQLRERCLVIAVDTAVRACVRAGVEPDFIVLVDPQYWNWRHLDGVSCPSSILITESAAWPAVFRFTCRAIYLCSSLFPLGRFLEARTGIKGELGAGGSVATTAWDFARHLGCGPIYMAGLDLGFPDRKTHFTGSIFEDRTHAASKRFAPSEQAGYLALYGAAPRPVPNYLGGTVLTDKRLILYAWWFESRLAAYPECKTATITPEGVRIPGFAVASVEDILAKPSARVSIDRILADIAIQSGKAEPIDEDGARFDAALAKLDSALAELGSLARRAICVCDELLAREGIFAEKKASQGERLRELDEIDRMILSHPAKDVAAMVFYGAKAEGCVASPIELSRKNYAELALAVEKNRNSLKTSGIPLKVSAPNPIF